MIVSPNSQKNHYTHKSNDVYLDSPYNIFVFTYKWQGEFNY